MSKIKKYRKKPVVIEAVKYTGCITDDIIEFTNNTIRVESNIGSSEDGEGYPQKYTRVTIPTLEGDHLVLEGDFIIKGVKGEVYPCKPDIFHMTYERDLTNPNNKESDE